GPFRGAAPVVRAASPVGALPEPVPGGAPDGPRYAAPGAGPTGSGGAPHPPLRHAGPPLPRPGGGGGGGSPGGAAAQEPSPAAPPRVAGHPAHGDGGRLEPADPQDPHGSGPLAGEIGRASCRESR